MLTVVGMDAETRSWILVLYTDILHGVHQGKSTSHVLHVVVTPLVTGSAGAVWAVTHPAQAAA